jgi:cytochrome c-type biogenesis protein CcmH
MMACMRSLLLLLAILLMQCTLSPGAFAVQPDEILPDKALELRARELSKELRCMVCQNQSIDDSDAPLARDLRMLVRERLQAGDSDRQVIEFLVARYGEFVLLRPRFSLHTAVLWLAPFGTLLLGGCALFLSWRRRPRSEESLTEREQARLSDVLESRQ